MTIFDYLKNKIRKWLKVEQLDTNPNDQRFTYISDDDKIKEQKLKEYRIWYIGDSDELLNYYTVRETFANCENPIYNRNRQNYFWGISSEEGDIKRVHSGIPNAIVTTLVNAIGMPKICSKSAVVQKALDDILEENDFTNILNQQQLPMTLVEGWGAYKVDFNETSDNPQIIYYEANDVEFVYKNNKLIGIIYKDYYTFQGKNFVLFETRRVDEEGSKIEFQLCKLENGNEIKPVDIHSIPELQDFDGETKVFPKLKRILGVPCKIFYDPLNKKYGRSIFAGKVDLFDDLDQILSQDSQTIRVSTPVEYYPVDLLERNGRNGEPKMPKAFNRQFIKKEGIPSGDGTMDGTIQTTQPNLNTSQYSEDAKNKLDYILTGLLSPATMGIDIAKKDNAEAQREKEKVTIMTRNNVIAVESRVIKALMELCLMLKEFKITGDITLDEDYQIEVKFDEFANPSFENELQVLGTAWRDGEISTEKYVELLWGDKLTEEDKQREIEALEQNRQSDNLTMGDFDGEADRHDYAGEGENEEDTPEIPK